MWYVERGGEVMVREGKGSSENTNYPAAAREWCVGSTGRGPPVEPGECEAICGVLCREWHP